MSEQALSIKQWFASDQVTNGITVILPKKEEAARFLKVAQAQFNKNPKLGLCTKQSILDCMVRCATFSIYPDGYNAHLIPYKETCTVIFDYKGLVAKAAENGVLAKATLVRKNDQFEYLEDDGSGKTVVRHSIDVTSDRGEIICVYGRAVYESGHVDYEIMTKAEVDSIRKRSKAANDGPWVTDEGEMTKKTVLRRHSKRWPLAPEIKEAFNADDDTPDFEQERFKAAKTVTATFDEPEAPEGLPESNKERSDKHQQPDSKDSRIESDGVDVEVKNYSTKDGTGKDGKSWEMHIFDLVTSEGDKVNASTFSESDARKLEDAMTEGSIITVILEKNGKYTNIKAVL